MAFISTQGPFTCNIKEYLIDEIALEGLEGIGLKLLWKRIEARTSAPITEKMKARYWNYIVNCKSISIYELPEPVPELELQDRLTIIDPETGYIKDPDDYLDGPYEYLPVENAFGSSSYYKSRHSVSNDVALISYDKVEAEYGDTLVLVASPEERWKALAPHLPLSFLYQLVPINYCMLELIGRARENGQMTTGKTNLTKIVKDPKLLFYHRKNLQNLDLVRVTCVTQVTAGRTVKGLLIRLKRFHKSDILTVPKSGLIYDLVDYLKNQPNFCEKTETVIKKGLMSQAQNKKFQKKVSIFHFEEKPVTSDLIYTTTPQDNENPKKPIRKRYMCLVSKSDESSDSEDEETTQPLKCQYKVGVNILRQAYERFLEAGRNGLTQYELAQLLGVEFYVCRTICRVFKVKNIIREFIECKGRQRLGRYIAIAATSKMDNKLAEEKEKFQKLLDEGNRLCQKRKRKVSDTSSDSESLNIKKKRKYEKKEVDEPEEGITEIKLIDGVRKPIQRKLNLKSKVSLRQLKFANGILKVLHEKTFVLGYQTLSNLVAAECNEAPMDTKAMKLLLQGMVSGGNLKIYKMKLPRSQFHYSIMICAPHIQPTDAALKEKYKELVQKVSLSQKIAQRKSINDSRPLSQYAYPRYVKVQKLHEALIKIMYFNDVKTELYNLPPGFFSIRCLIPELTIGVALGHISSEGVLDVSRFTIEDSLLEVKVRDAPVELYRTLVKSNNLQASLRTILKILAQFGLIQLVVQATSDATETPDNCMAINLFYVNRYAKIIDTAGLWPRENTDLESLEREFHFDSMEVVKEYWNTVYHISTNTTVEVPNRRQKNIQLKAPVRTVSQALEMDNGERFGNGLGPCGFDSMYYLDVPRLWKAYCIRSTSWNSKRKKKTVKIPKLEIPKKPKVSKKKLSNLKKMAFNKKPDAADVAKGSIKLLGEKNKKRMRLAKIWTPDDDRLLMMCKTAMTIMSPISQPGSLRVRNLAAKDILSIRDPKKTQGICHKRMAFIESNSTLIHERNCILNELRRQNILDKYEGLLKKLRILYSTNMTKYINEARLPMMELVWIIYQISKNLPLLQEISCTPLNLEEFHKNYTIASSTKNQASSLYKSPHDGEVMIGTLKEAIILTVMQSFNTEVSKKSAKIIYSFFHKYSETDLRTAIEPLRKSGAIAAKDKVIRTQMHIVDLDDLVQCSYRISAVYQRKWISRLNSEFSDSLAECFKGDVNRDALKASPEVNCFCFEQQANGLLELVAVTVPVITGPSGSIIQEDQLNVIDIATNFKLKSGTIGRKNKSEFTSYADLYKDYLFKINDALESLGSRSFTSNVVREKKNMNVIEDSDIISYLKTKCEKGATLSELQETLNYSRGALTTKLTELEATNVIKRVGFYENAVVLIKYIKHWSMTVPNGFILPEPWLDLEGKVRPDIFFKWAGIVMNKIFECPGCSLNYLSESSEFLTTRAVQDVVDVLVACDCVTLHTLLNKEPSLFSDTADDDASPELGDYNEYESPKKNIALPVKDCLSKYSYVKNLMLIKSDTISFASEDSQ